jgi:hypothetical protein
MSEKIEPIIHKMTEAIPDVSQSPARHPDAEAGNPVPLENVDQKQHNAEVHPGHRDRLVDIGRGHDTAGRGGQKGGRASE